MNHRSGLLAVTLLVTGNLCCAQQVDEQTRAYWEAARTGHVDEVRRLIAAGVDLDAVTEFNCGAIYFAANRNQAEVIRLLAESGADVNLRDTDYEFTPVQMAAWLGHTEATAALIDAGAGRNDTIGSCFAAASNGHADTVELIVQKLKIPPAQLNAMWKTANGSGHQNVCRKLEQLGATPAKSAKSGNTDSKDDASPGKNKSASRTVEFDFESDQALPVAAAANWPAFRGANRAGIADGQHPPAAFDLASGRNIRWQTDVDGLGLSSPIIQDGRVYITTATSSATEQTVDDNGLGWIASVPEDVPHQWKVLCYDLNDGSLLWEQTACEGKPQSQRHWKASQANSSCVTDGQNLLALFGSEGLYCYDLDGNLTWKKDLGRLDAGWYIDSTFPWGFASSPVIYKDSVILQCDIYDTPFIAALNLQDGSELWRTERPDELPSWGTPLVIEGPDRDELVTNASKAIRGYDPNTGKLLWQIDGNSPITVASPVAAAGLTIATGGYKSPQPIYVVRTGMATGNVTPADEVEQPSIAWSRQNGGVYTVTPLLYRGLLYMCKQNGILSVYDPETGEEKYKKRVGTGDITASPVAADGKIWFVGENGRVVVIGAGDKYERIVTCDLGSASLATPAISNGTIVFRTVKGLVAVAHDNTQP